MSEREFQDDPGFMAWLKSFTDHWESEYTGNVEAMFAAYRAGAVAAKVQTVPRFAGRVLEDAKFTSLGQVEGEIWFKLDEDRITIIGYVPEIGWGYCHWYRNTGKSGTRNAQWAESNADWTALDALEASQHEPGWSEYGKRR